VTRIGELGITLAVVPSSSISDILMKGEPVASCSLCCS
jgi:hypothetical protein